MQGFGAAQLGLGGQPPVNQTRPLIPAPALASSVQKVATAGGDHELAPPEGAGVSPPPGPAPSGNASAPAAGAAGVPVGALAITGLLLMGAPWLVRRLRLQREPLLPAPLVLIPERPG
jgi:hypothetical protein